MEDTAIVLVIAALALILGIMVGGHVIAVGIGENCTSLGAFHYDDKVYVCSPK